MIIEKILKKFIKKLVPIITIEDKKDIKRQKLTPHKDLKRDIINTGIIGIGGCGNKIIEKAYEKNLKNTDYLYMDNDNKSLASSSIVNKIVIDKDLPNIDEFTQNKDILFFVGGLGGGTASKLLPSISDVVIQKNIITFGIVTKPFGFEGNVRKNNFKKYLDEINKDTDVLIIVDNDKLMKMSQKNTSMIEAFDILNDFVVDFIQKTIYIINNSLYIDKEDIAIKSIKKSMDNPLFEIVESKNFESKLIELLKKCVVDKEETEELEIPKFLMKND